MWTVTLLGGALTLPSVPADSARTRETLMQMQLRVPALARARSVFVPSFYEDASDGAAAVRSILAAVREHATEADATALLIGHNPGWEQAVAALTGGDPEQAEPMDTAHAALLKGVDRDWAALLARGALLWEAKGVFERRCVISPPPRKGTAAKAAPPPPTADAGLRPADEPLWEAAKAAAAKRTAAASDSSESDADEAPAAAPAAADVAGSAASAAAEVPAASAAEEVSADAPLDTGLRFGDKSLWHNAAAASDAASAAAAAAAAGSADGADAEVLTARAADAALWARVAADFRDFEAAAEGGGMSKTEAKELAKRAAAGAAGATQLAGGEAAKPKAKGKKKKAEGADGDAPPEPEASKARRKAAESAAIAAWALAKARAAGNP